MLVSTPTKDYVALRNPTTLSPSYRTSRIRKDPSKYDSTLLSASPLRQRSLFPSYWSDPTSNMLDSDDLFTQSPRKQSIPAQAHIPYPSRPQPIAADDDDGSIFLTSSSTSPTIPVSMSQPLRTPVKQVYGLSNRPALSERQLNTPLNVKSPSSSADATRVGVGKKRKQDFQNMSTPLRPHTLAPLKAAGSKTVDPRATTCFMFDRLAPLDEPKFIIRTPQTKAETEAYLRRQTATLTKLKLADLDHSDDEFSLDPPCHLDDEMDGFISTPGTSNGGYKLLSNRGKDKEEVAEAVSPGGHVIKRRARSRPVSADLLESALHPSPTKRSVTGAKFPTTRSHAHSSSGSSMEPSSPRPRRRVGGASHPYNIRSAQSPLSPRAPMNRVSSGSSASLFFGPSIPPPELPQRNRTTSSTTPAPVLRAGRPPHVSHRRSWGSFGNDLKAWNTIQSRTDSPSPESSPARMPRRQSLQDEEDAFFGGTAHNSSFRLSVNEGTPSPRTRRLDPGTLQRKYRPRDSGVVISDEEDISFLSTRVDGRDPETDINAFIIRTLSTASKGVNDGIKRAPGTPVKKMKTTFLTADRPWQSAVAPKVGLRYDLDEKKSRAPRKSLPAALSRKQDDEQTTDSEGEDDSPIASRGKYLGLGLGRPHPPLLREDIRTRANLLMRRSSSGAFSSGSDSISLVGTPTRLKGEGKGLFPLPSVALHGSPKRTSSGSSTNSSVVATSPIKRSRPSQPIGSDRPAPRSSSLARRLIEPSSEEQSGRYARDFNEIDELGSGEFGKVIKVQSKNEDLEVVYAIKKSKQFEGPKHRLRLREEVEILKHLPRYGHSIGIEGRHPNVLAYIDSWEEDEALYIQTELCESGNLARFLWEYGRAFPRLDEARVWKIIVDLSNGLRYIHGAGVIHLDLKPSNIFLTKDGRLKIGDFGMASLWPRKPTTGADSGGFEREGDKLYLAPEVLQGWYGKAADVFSFGMTILETASNIVVPDQGEAWHRLRQGDFSQVDLDDSPELLGLITQLMCPDATKRISAQDVFDHPIVSRARVRMEQTYEMAVQTGTPTFAASPLASVPDSFLAEIRGCHSMDTSP